MAHDVLHRQGTRAAIRHGCLACCLAMSVFVTVLSPQNCPQNNAYIGHFQTRISKRACAECCCHMSPTQQQPHSTHKYNETMQQAAHVFECAADKWRCNTAIKHTITPCGQQLILDLQPQPLLQSRIRPLS